MNSMNNNYLTILLLVIFMASTSFAAGAQTSVKVSGAKGKSTYRINNDEGDFKLEYEGEIQVSDNDKDIVAISRGGFFELSKSSFGASRKIRIETDGSQLIKKYFVGWSEKDWEPDGRDWLAELLPDLVRSTTIAARSRVDRIYRQGGADALVRELSLLEGDYVRHTYFNLAFEKNLSASDQNKLLKIAGETVSSDHYLSQILTGYFERNGLSGAVSDNYLTAADAINSDHYKTNVLSTVAMSDAVKGQQLTRLIKGSNGIASDHYKANLLMEIIGQKKLDDNQISALLEESNDIQSDHYSANVLIKLLQEQDLSSSSMNSFLNTTGHIQSDHYAQNVYAELLMKKRDNQTLASVFSSAGRTVNSDHYLSQVLRIGLRYQDISGPAMTEFIDAISDIGSDHYASEVIREAAKLELSEEDAIKLLQASGNISSDNYLSNSLVALSGQVNRMGDNVKSAYRSAAKEISSDTYYGRAMKALDE